MTSKQILRNGVVLALLVAICEYLSLPEGLFLALAALVVLESDLGGGLLAAKERMLGTIFGLLAVIISAGILLPLSLPLAISCGFLLVRIFGFAAGLASGYIVAGNVVAGSLVHHGADWWYYSFWRTFMTLLGLLLGLLVSRQIYSSRFAAHWHEQALSWLLDFSLVIQQVITGTAVLSSFDQLRERRNKLFGMLPKLFAEQQFLVANRFNFPASAQDFVLQTSALLSCSRDLSILLAEPAGPLRNKLPIAELLNLASSLLRIGVLGDASGMKTEPIRQQILIIQNQLIESVHSEHEPGLEDLKICSRLLLLAEALLIWSPPVLA